MGLGGYLAVKSDAEHYAAERATEQREVEMISDIEVAENEQAIQGRRYGRKTFKTKFEYFVHISGLDRHFGFYGISIHRQF